jgi:ferritin-like protein
MSWEAAHVLITSVVAVAALGNYFVLLSIKLKVAELEGALREWARGEFAAKDHFERLEERIRDLELRKP